MSHKTSVYFVLILGDILFFLLSCGAEVSIEVKSGQTVNRDFFTGLERWVRIAGELAGSPALIYGGTDSYTHQGVDIVAWNRCGTAGE